MFSSTTYAAEPSSWFAQAASQAYGLEELIVVGVAILLLLSVIIAIFFILAGGFLLILSGGKEEKVKPAISMIRYSVIGLIVMIAIVLLIPPLSRAFGFSEIGNKFQVNQIFSTMGCVTDRLFGQENLNCFNLTNTGGSFGNSPNGVGDWTNSF